MSGRNCSASVKKYLMAARGGKVPDDVDMSTNEEDDDEPEQGEEEASAEPEADEPMPPEVPESEEPQQVSAAPIAAAPAAAPTMEADKLAAIKDYLSQQYAKASDNSGVLAAQDEAKHTNFVANIGDALETLAKSNSMAHGGAGVDSGFYKGIRDQGNQGVQAAVANRQSAIQNLSQQLTMQHQVVQDLMARGDHEQKQKTAAIAASFADPNSQASKNAREAFAAAFGKDHPELVPPNLENFSAHDIEKISKNAEFVVRADSTKLAKQQMQENRQDQMTAKKEATDKATAVKEFANLGKDLDNELATAKNGIGLATNKVNGALRLMTFADVTPDEIEAAKKDPAAMAALKKKMDGLTPQQYSEVVSGLMTQISPSGGGSLGQFQHLKANSASETLANVKQYFGSNPAPAGMGGIIANNLLTLKNEADTSQKVIDDHNAKMINKHPKAFKHAETAQEAQNLLEAFTKKAAEPPMAVGQNSAPPPANAHPQVNEAADWARNNPNDPRSAEILKRLGSANAGL